MQREQVKKIKTLNYNLLCCLLYGLLKIFYRDHDCQLVAIVKMVTYKHCGLLVCLVFVIEPVFGLRRNAKLRL